MKRWPLLVAIVVIAIAVGAGVNLLTGGNPYAKAAVVGVAAAAMAWVYRDRKG